jgi:flagellar FliJ protein
MTRAKRLAPVQDIADDAERRLAQSLGACEKRVRDNEAKLQELERYREEYEKQFTTRAGQGMGVTDLRDYQAFLSRLKEAIRQQHTLVQRAVSERDGERLKWQDAARRAKALDHVVEKWNAEDRSKLERREQQETDERGQRRTGRE